MLTAQEILHGAAPSGTMPDDLEEGDENDRDHAEEQERSQEPAPGSTFLTIAEPGRVGWLTPTGENESGDAAEPGWADESPASIRCFVEQDQFRLPVGIGGSARVADPDRTVLEDQVGVPLGISRPGCPALIVSLPCRR